jgi:hypothetical protein
MFACVFETKVIDGREMVLLAPFCSVRGNVYEDDACLIQSGEHGCVVQETFIKYSKMRVDKVADVLMHLNSGYFPRADDVSSDLLKRIVGGIEKSKRVPRHIRKEWL